MVIKSLYNSFYKTRVFKTEIILFENTRVLRRLPIMLSINTLGKSIEKEG